MVDIYQFKMECNKGVGETGINEVREITFYDTMLNKFNTILHRSSIRCQYLSCCSKVWVAVVGGCTSTTITTTTATPRKRSCTSIIPSAEATVGSLFVAQTRPDQTKGDRFVGPSVLGRWKLLLSMCITAVI